MSKRIFTAVEISRLKREATLLRKRDGIPHHEALARVAKREGFPDWRELRHWSTLPRSGEATVGRPVVRFVMDPKDAEGLDDERLKSHGFARDDRFTDELIAKAYPDAPWEGSSWLVAFRFIEWPGDDVSVVVKRIQETFFFTPDEIWFGDTKIPETQWKTKDAASALARDASREEGSAEAIIEDHFSELADLLVNGNGHVGSEMAMTNAAAFGLNQGEVNSAEFDDDGRISFSATVYLAGEQHPDRPWNGDELTVDLTGVATPAGDRWTFSDIEVESVETNT